jgi:PAS domain S-box-containing protein
MARRQPAARDAEPAQLLSALAEIADDPPDLTAFEAIRRVLGLGAAAVGAAGGAAHLIDARGEAVDVAEAGATASIPPAAAELVARSEEAWLGTSAAIGARFPGSPAPGALASLRVDVGGQQQSGLVFWFDQERVLSEFERAFLKTLGVLLVQRMEARDVARMTRWGSVLSDSFRLVLSPTSLKRTLDELARVSCETPADFSSICALSADGKLLEYRAVHHRDPAQVEGLRAALEGRTMSSKLGAIGCVIETGKSLLLPTVDMEQVLRTYEGTPFGDYAKRVPVCTVMAAALRSRGTVFGVVMLARVTPEPFQPPDLRFLEEVANRAAVALENTNLLEKLVHSEEQLRVALEAGRLGAWEWDIPGSRVTWSTVLERIHGLDTGTFPGTFEAYQRDIHPDDRAHVLASISQAVENRTDHHVVYRIVRPDGETRWLEAHGRLLCDATGTPKRLVGVCVDITERKRSEEQLRHMVLALKDADQRKDQFLAMLAHELRNPLAPMLNATHVLRFPDGNEEMSRRATEILDRQVGHMARLLDDLLDVSRISRGKIELLRESVDVGALTREVAGDHLASFQAAGLTLQLVTPAEPLFVHADRARLSQVIGNLLSNAIKFSQRGQKVHLRVERDVSLQTMVLTVRDQGTGIEPALLASIFEPFVQAETSLSRPRGGLGLGLAVVQGLVTLHGGRVSAASDGPGKGAEFRIEMPLQTGHVPAHSPPESSTGRGGPATILVFEDNADAAESLRVVLAAAGYDVALEATGRDAMAAVKRVRPAVVLCDLGLPERDGYAIAADIRADPEWAHLHLIAISGYGSAEDHVRSSRAGFNLHLTKPVPPALLLTELSHRINGATAKPRPR